VPVPQLAGGGGVWWAFALGKKKLTPEPLLLSRSSYSLCLNQTLRTRIDQEQWLVLVAAFLNLLGSSRLPYFPNSPPRVASAYTAGSRARTLQITGRRIGLNGLVLKTVRSCLPKVGSLCGRSGPYQNRINRARNSWRSACQIPRYLPHVPYSGKPEESPSPLLFPSGPILAQYAPLYLSEDGPTPSAGTLQLLVVRIASQHQIRPFRGGPGQLPAAMSPANKGLTDSRGLARCARHVFSHC